MQKRQLVAVKIEKASGTGFCFGVKRAITILEKAANDQGKIETLGAVVHNKKVLQRLKTLGVTVADSVANVKGKTLAIGAHGVGPEVEAEINARNLKIIDTTCRSVHRAQIIAERLSKAGFFVVVYGDAEHPEVKGILSWAGGKGIATRDANVIAGLKPLPKCIGVLSQTTGIPSSFIKFVKELLDTTFGKNSELQVVDTICHDIQRRQVAAESLAKHVDLMFVVGDHTSANTNRLAELCGKLTKTHFIETADEIKKTWLKGHKHIGITGGASTSEDTINEVVDRLESMICG
jgi:4-hydroxy-3-methylbut-2-enyl diphosphate reductase